MIRCRVRFIVKVLSPRDGAWTRMFGYVKTYADALQCVNLFMPMMNLAGDYDNFQIRKQFVSFPSQLRAHDARWPGCVGSN